jgi:adenosine deaminase
VRVSINTDDPALMGHTLVEEYVESAAAYAWEFDTLRQLARTSIEASFCDSSLRQRLLESV